MINVVFDFSGTLADAGELNIEIYNTLAEKYKHKKVDQKDFERMSSMSVSERMKLLGLSKVKLLAWIVDLKRLVKERTKDFTLPFGMGAALRELNAMPVNMYIISSNDPHEISKYLKANDIEYFKKIVKSSGLFGKSKAIKDFLHEFKLVPADTLYVGDEVRDIQACQANGIEIIAVCWGYDSQGLLEEYKPNYRVKDAGEMVQIIVSRLKKGGNSHVQ
ncbi:MAG: HAD-IA family hydrolase [Peptococcaceae bacterium]|nr:HAD-IA family hydrolase [Peptococcaceae bacterium]